MAGENGMPSTASDDAAVKIDTTVAHAARIYDYWLGGKDNFAVDREAAEQAIAAYPGILPGVRANRAFLANAVHYLVEEAGIRQFLDIGTGLPSANNTHQVAQAAAPESRVVYVDNDKIVLAHARALLTSSPEGATAYVDADLRQTRKILAEAARVLDISRPVAVMLLAILQLVSDADDPHAVVAELMASLPSGSYLVISHPASDLAAEEMGEMARRLNEHMSPASQATFRTEAQVRRFFDGLDMVEPGLVHMGQWRPGHGVAGRDLPTYCGVARKP